MDAWCGWCALCQGTDMAGNAAHLSRSKPGSNHKEMCACHRDLLSSKPLVGPEKHSETSLAIIPDTRLAPGCATWGMKKQWCYSGLLAPGTLEQHKILALIEGLGVRIIPNKEPHIARFLIRAVSTLVSWNWGCSCIRIGAGEVMPILAALAWKEIARLCCLYIPKSRLCVPCSFLCAGALRLVGTKLLFPLGEKGPGIYSSIGICLPLGPGLSASQILLNRIVFMFANSPPQVTH